MNDTPTRRPSHPLDRLRLLGPFLIAVAALIVAACNNGAGSGY